MGDVAASNLPSFGFRENSPVLLRYIQACVEILLNLFWHYETFLAPLILEKCTIWLMCFAGSFIVVMSGYLKFDLNWFISVVNCFSTTNFTDMWLIFILWFCFLCTALS